MEWHLLLTQTISYAAKAVLWLAGIVLILTGPEQRGRKGG